jgi:phage host-nuclease inhibitor protein Gam
VKRFEIRIPRMLKINLVEEVINFLSFNGAEEYIENSKHINKYKTM